MPVPVPEVRGVTCPRHSCAVGMMTLKLVWLMPFATTIVSLFAPHHQDALRQKHPLPTNDLSVILVAPVASGGHGMPVTY